MAHELTNSRSMFYVGAAPWHQLGVKLENAPTCAEGIHAAGLNWTVGLKDLQTTDGQDVTHKATFRTDTGRILGVVGPGWTPLQNTDAFAFFDPFLQAGEATLETAGSLKGDRRIWVLAKINRPASEIVKGDTVEKYILLANSHDGSLAIRVGYTPIRVVCNNTLSAAIAGRKGSLIRVRHRKNVVGTLDAVRETMNAADASFEATAEQYRRLARTAIVSEDLKRLVRRVFAQAPKADAVPPQIMSVPIPADLPPPVSDPIDRIFAMVDTTPERESRVVEAVSRLYEEGRGNNLPGVRGTAWAAYNAITEYIGYERGNDDARRLDETWFGAGAALNHKALIECVELARQAGQ